MLLHHQLERVARLAEDFPAGGGPGQPAAREPAQAQVEQALQVSRAAPPAERAGLERQVVLAPGFLGVGIDFPDPDHRIVPPDELFPGLALEHPDRPLVGRLEAPVRAEDQDEQPGVRDHETRLPPLPGVPDQGRAEDVDGQEREQHGEPGALVDVILGRGGAIARLEPGREGERRRQRADADDRQLERGQEPIDRVDRPQKPIHQGASRFLGAARRTSGGGRGNGSLLRGSGHERTYPGVGKRAEEGPGGRKSVLIGSPG